MQIRQASPESLESRYAAFGLPRAVLAQPRLYANHALHYDPGRKIPLWVAELLTPATVNECSDCAAISGEEVSRKKAQFKPDPELPQELSSSNKDYWHSGFSRGHMAPAGDNKHSQKALNDTFLLTNILPQDIKNNGGYWNMMELFARDLTKKVPRVFVVSGPLFRTEKEGDKTFVKYQVIGAGKVAVPSHLYKVVVVEQGGDKPLVGAFVVPNRRVPLQTPLAECRVELEELEREVGFRLLPRLPPRHYAHLCDSSLGCSLMPVSEFQAIIYHRKLSNARKAHWLEKQWAKVERDGLQDHPELRAMYEAKKRELEEGSAEEAAFPALPVPKPA